MCRIIYTSPPHQSRAWTTCSFNRCLVRGWCRFEVTKPQRGGSSRALQQHFSKGPMSDYLSTPVIIQRDLNLPATLRFDGSAHSLSVRLSYVRGKADNFRVICCFYRVKYARCGCDIHFIIGMSSNRSLCRCLSGRQNSVTNGWAPS